MRFVPGGAAVVVAAAVAASALSACTGDAVAIVTETPSPTVVASDATSPTVLPMPMPMPMPMPTPTPTPSPSEYDAPLTDDEVLALMPDSAGDAGTGGAAATAVAYAQMAGSIFVDRDTRLWRALALPECGYCASQIENVANLTTSGDNVDGGTVIIDYSSVRAVLAGSNRAFVTVEAVVGSLIRYGSDGMAITVNEPYGAEFAFDLRHSGQVWRVAGVDLRIVSTT